METSTPSKFSREVFLTTLQADVDAGKDGAAETLSAYSTSMDKLKNDWVVQEIFHMDATCEYYNIPNNSAANNASGAWGEYTRTGVWNGKKRF